ncbi:MAG: metalloprotease [Tabrizicola sp.]
MLPVLAALALCAATLYTLRGGLLDNGRFVTLAGLDAPALVTGAMALAAAVYFFDPLYGVALVLSVMIHEFGHVAAYRVCGHADARFRLIPLIGGVAISDRPPASHAEEVFITLMGPGICLAPMVLALAVLNLGLIQTPLFNDFLWTFALVTGAINFFNLLPFWPLDGGRCLSMLSQTFAPRIALQVTIAMAIAAILLAILMQSFALTAFALLGAQYLVGDETGRQSRMGRQHGLLAAAAYLAALASFGLVGWPLIARFI